INKGNGATGTAGIQSYNSQGVTMNGGSITNFGSVAVGGQRPLGVNILHDNTYANATGTFNFAGVTFNGGVGNSLGGGIAQYLQDNANITVSVTGGSSFTNVYGKAIITQ